VNTSADSTNRLAVSSSATLLSHEGSDHRVKVNKAAAGDTASLLFQSGWSGRGEIGLMGSDDFGVKVSADGATFHDAVSIDRTSGAVSFPSGVNGTGSAAGPMGGQVVTITGAEAQTFTVGALMAIGGASAVGAVMPFAGRVLAASIAVADGPAGTNTASMAVNGAEDSGYQVSVAHGGGAVPSTGIADFTGAPLGFAAGDALNMIASASSGAIGVVTTLFVQFD
jgi:hypothetical protein